MRGLLAVAVAVCFVVDDAASASVPYGPIFASRACFAAAADIRQTRSAIRRGIRICTVALGERSGPAGRAALLVNRGIVRQRGGQLEAAIADYDAALALAPGLPEALVNKGVAFRRAGRSREAVDLLTAGIAAGPSRPEVAYYQRGIANEAIGAVRDAYRDYVEAKMLAPDWADPVEELKRFTVVRRRTAAG